MSHAVLLDAWTSAEILRREAIIKAQAGIIDALEAELEGMKTRGRNIILALDVQVKSFLAGLSWVEAERDYYKEGYEAVIKLFGLNGGGGKITLGRADSLIDYIMSVDRRKNLLKNKDGRKYLTLDEVISFLENDITDCLKLSLEVKYPRMAAMKVCRRAITEAGKRGINIKRVRGGLGKKMFVLEYIPDQAPEEVTAGRQRGRPKGINAQAARAVLEALKRPAAWARNHGALPQATPETWKDLFKKYG